MDTGFESYRAIHVGKFNFAIKKLFIFFLLYKSVQIRTDTCQMWDSSHLGGATRIPATHIPVRITGAADWGVFQQELSCFGTLARMCLEYIFSSSVHLVIESDKHVESTAIFRRRKALVV